MGRVLLNLDLFHSASVKLNAGSIKQRLSKLEEHIRSPRKRRAPAEPPPLAIRRGRGTRMMEPANATSVLTGDGYLLAYLTGPIPCVWGGMC